MIIIGLNEFFGGGMGVGLGSYYFYNSYRYYFKFVVLGWGLFQCYVCSWFLVYSWQ